MGLHYWIEGELNQCGTRKLVTEGTILKALLPHALVDCTDPVLLGCKAVISVTSATVARFFKKGAANSTIESARGTQHQNLTHQQRLSKHIISCEAKLKLLVDEGVRERGDSCLRTGGWVHTFVYNPRFCVALDALKQAFAPKAEILFASNMHIFYYSTPNYREQSGTEMREAVHKKLVQEYYSKRAIDYDRQKARTWKARTGFEAQILSEIVRAALTVRTGLGLEIGVGSGRVCLPLIKETKLSFVGIDLSREMLELAQRKMTAYRRKSDLLLGDAERLPFHDNIFSLLVCTSTLHYLPSLKRVLDEFSRVLKTKGVFVYGDVGMHEMDTTGFMDQLERTISSAHARYAKPSEMRTLIEEYGIHVTKTKIIPYRKSYASLIEDKANYFNIKSERLFRLIAESTTEQKALYQIDEKQMTLFYVIVIGLKE